MTLRWIYAAAATLALLVTGLVHGYWTTPDASVLEAARLLDEIPLELGEWVGNKLEVKPGQAGVGVTGCIQRTYTHKTRGTQVVVALVNGKPGPVSIHTPEVCYGANGYMVGERRLTPLDIPGLPAQFWSSDAVKTTVTEETRIRIYWAWCAGEGWVASTDARQQFPRHRFPVLHKLYVVRDLNKSPELGKEEACEAFLKVLLPELQKTLFHQGS
jgi:hypothetical protein